MDVYILSCLLSVGKLVNSVKYSNYELSTSEGRTLVVLLNANVNARKCAVLCSKFATTCDGFKLDSPSCALYAVKETLPNERRGKSVQMYLNSKLSLDPTVQRRNKSTKRRKTSTSEQSTFRSPEPSTTWSTESTTSGSKFTTTETSSVQSPSPTNLSTKLLTMFGVPCKKDGDCKYRHGQCIGGKCTCKTGSSFDFKHNTCIEKCTEYGTKFTKYRLRGIKGCSPESYDGVKNGDVCKELCVNSTKILCIIVQYSMWKKECHLCDKAWVDIPDKDKEQKTSFTTYTLHYRHCK